MKLNGTSTSIKISSINIDLGESLPLKIQEELLHIAGTHLGRLNHATVGFAREGHSYGCTINVQVSNLKVIVGEASATNCHQAFDQALGKVSRQLQRKRQHNT